ncbi:MAG: ribonuclease HI [Bacillaceae bacterium G1]|nr:ribonuclease HI [Bacillota bacterium]OJF16614.1 MAG: ribonuclease HI [Bacillaceae bacterium G1]
MAEQQGTEKEVIIYTDGACSGNPGPGGWAAILMYGEHRKEISGGEVSTTNNRMELTAAIEALRQLKRPCRVTLYSDSAYLVNAFEQGWLEKWQQNGWRNSKKEPVENQDLWQALLDLTRRHDVRFCKVKGHHDNPWNNRCDALAVAAIPNTKP